MYLNNDEIKQAFLEAHLEGNHNFLMDDLVKLANAFINKAKPKVAQEERNECIKVARSLNGLVADKIKEVRG